MHRAQPCDLLSVLWWQQVGFHLTAFEFVPDFTWTPLKCSSLCFTHDATHHSGLSSMLPSQEDSDDELLCDDMHRMYHYLKRSRLSAFRFIFCLPWDYILPERRNLAYLVFSSILNMKSSLYPCGTVSTYWIWHSSCFIGWINEWSHQIFITIIQNIISLKNKEIETQRS